MLPPLPRCSGWAYSSLKLPHPYQPSPIPLSGRPAHRPFRGLLGVHSRCGLHTRAITKFVTAIRGLQTFRHLHACPGCFRLERIAGWALHPLGKAPPCHGARGLPTFAIPCERLGRADSRRSPTHAQDRRVRPRKPPFPPTRSAIDAVSSVLHPSPRRWVAFVLGFRAVVAGWRMECTVGASLRCLAAR